MAPSLPSLYCSLVVAWALLHCLAACQQSGVALEAGSNCRPSHYHFATFKVLAGSHASMVWGIEGMLHLDIWVQHEPDVQIQTIKKTQTLLLCLRASLYCRIVVLRMPSDAFASSCNLSFSEIGLMPNLISRAQQEPYQHCEANVQLSERFVF